MPKYEAVQKLMIFSRHSARNERTFPSTSSNAESQLEAQTQQISRNHEVTEETPLLQSQPVAERYSVFSDHQKRLIILTAAIASTFSPFSANIYYPALNSIAADLGVNNSQINLTITTYMVWCAHAYITLSQV